MGYAYTCLRPAETYLPINFTMQVNPVSLAEGAFLLKVILGMWGFLVT
ncbi:hypothetical protein AGMMS49531_10870 [Endomicrobiia bacterium]|nr:hypothetical protein AGMMS49531_10870 [Endomicrobiia bacterium]